MIIETIKFLLKSVNHFWNNACHTPKTIIAHVNNTIGDIAEINILNIDIEGAKALRLAEFTNQSNDTTDSDEVFTLDKGENIFVIIFGKFIL